MDSGTLPTGNMLLNTNDSHHSIANNDSSMTQYSELFGSRPSGPSTTKTNKRKLEELVDPSSNEFDPSSTLKPQKTDQPDPERTISRTGTRTIDLLNHFCMKLMEINFLIYSISSPFQWSATIFDSIKK